MIVESYNNNGVPWVFSDNDIRFLWFDWVVAEISFRHGNPVHLCIASCFQEDNCLVWNPSWEGEQRVRYVKLNVFRVVRVIVSKDKLII